MGKNERKTIFWLEDDPEDHKAHLRVLRISYDVEIGAHPELIMRKRQSGVDLLILDIMIHLASFEIDTNREVENIKFDIADWKYTGLEFVRRIRAGEYSEWGFGRSIPIIVISAIIDYEIQSKAKDLGFSAYLGKPCTIDELTTAVQSALS